MLRRCSWAEATSVGLSYLGELELQRYPLIVLGLVVCQRRSTPSQRSWFGSLWFGISCRWKQILPTQLFLKGIVGSLHALHWFDCRQQCHQHSPCTQELVRWCYPFPAGRCPDSEIAVREVIENNIDQKMCGRLSGPVILHPDELTNNPLSHPVSRRSWPSGILEYGVQTYPQRTIFLDACSEGTTPISMVYGV